MSPNRLSQNNIVRRAALTAVLIGTLGLAACNQDTGYTDGLDSGEGVAAAAPPAATTAMEVVVGADTTAPAQQPVAPEVTTTTELVLPARPPIVCDGSKTYPGHVITNPERPGMALVSIYKCNETGGKYLITQSVPDGDSYKSGFIKSVKCVDGVLTNGAEIIVPDEFGYKFPTNEELTDRDLCADGVITPEEAEALDIEFLFPAQYRGYGAVGAVVAP